MTKQKIAIATGLKKEIIRFFKKAPKSATDEMTRCLEEHGTSNTKKLIKTVLASNDTKDDINDNKNDDNDINNY